MVQGVTIDQDQVDRIVQSMTIDQEEVDRVAQGMAVDQDQIDRMVQGMTIDQDQVDRMVQSMTIDQDQVDRMVQSMPIDQEEVDRLVQGMTIDQDQVDRMLHTMILSQNDINKLFSNDDIFEQLNQDIIEAYRNTDFSNFHIDDDFEDVSSNSERGLTVIEKFIYTKGLAGLLIEDIRTEPAKLLAISMILGTIILPLVVQDPDVTDLEDIIRRIHWTLIFILWAFGD